MKHGILTMAMAAGLLLGGLTLNSFAAADRALPRRGEVAERVKEKLGLTDEQVKKIKSEVASEKSDISDVAHRLHTARTELRETIQKPDATENEIRGASAKVAAVEADAAVLRAKLHKKISPVLTSEQQGKIKKAQKHVGQLVDRIIDRIGERLSE
jgi:Spy/CpxP family protein refolding chaperone